MDLVWGCACHTVEFENKDANNYMAKLWLSDELLGDSMLPRVLGSTWWAVELLHSSHARQDLCPDAQYKLSEGSKDLLIFKQV